MEPLTGIEPVTSSFAYTSIFSALIRGLDCILILKKQDSLVSRSGVPPTGGRHGLNLVRSLTVIRDSLECCHSSGQKFVLPMTCSTN